MSTKETVFLSSVTQGMEPYREAVYQAIVGLDGYHCVRMEQFGARDLDSGAYCRASVGECTVFVGILGHQYGSVHTSGKSYTEGEYDAAVECGLRRLMFLAPDDFPVQAHLIESDAKRESQRRFRERAKQDRLVDFFDSENELAQKVLQAIHNCQDTIHRQMGPVGPMKSPVPEPNGRTWLLFPFVTNQAGFDTAIAISNVSCDPIGTKPRAGQAWLYFYGTNAPTKQTVSTVAAGTTFTTLTSVCAAGFQGYIVAECDFPARGFAFVSDLGARNIASGYLAEVIRTDPEG